MGFSATGSSSSGVYPCNLSKRALRKYSQVKYICLSHSIRYSRKTSRPYSYLFYLSEPFRITIIIVNRDKCLKVGAMTI